MGCAVGVGFQGRYGLRGKVVGDLMGPLQSVHRRIGGLLLCDVLSRCFTQGGRGFFHIENVIGDLESPSYGFAEMAKTLNIGFGCARADRTRRDRGTNEGSGFASVNVFEHFRSNTFAFGFEVCDLSADHAVYRTRRRCDFVEYFYAKIGRDWCLAYRCEGKRKESVARQDGDGFSELLVASGFASAQIVVVEGGKVVVDERVRVDELDGASRVERRGDVGGKNTRGLKTKDRAYALAAGKDRITHGFVNRSGRRGRRREKAFEGGVDQLQIFVEEGG